MAIRTITMICFGLLIETMAAQTAPGIHIPDKPENLAQLREINLDIWKPFSEAYATNDAEKYIGLHALDFIRANGGTWAATKNLNEYAVGVRKNFARNIAQNRKVTIDFTFFERAAGAETASERGIYRVSSTEKDSLPQFFYGQFHVFHRKIGGKWKIAVDYDSDENGTITAEQFNAGWPTEVLLASDAEKRLLGRRKRDSRRRRRLFRIFEKSQLGGRRRSLHPRRTDFPARTKRGRRPGSNSSGLGGFAKNPFPQNHAFGDKNHWLGGLGLGSLRRKIGGHRWQRI